MSTQAWCLSSMPSTRVSGGETGDNVSRAARWSVSQPIKSRELEAVHQYASIARYLGQCGRIGVQTVLEDHQGVI